MIELFLLGVGLCVYLFPTAIAMMRGKHNTVPIFVLNLLMGWTGIGWVIAFMWSVMPDKNRHQAVA